MLVLLPEVLCILPFQVKKQTPIIDRPWTQITALLHHTYNIFVFEIGQNKFNLPVTAMFQNPFNNEEFIGFKIKQIDSRPPETGSNDISYRVTNHAKIIPYWFVSLNTITSQQNPIISYHSLSFFLPLIFCRADKIKKLVIFFVFAKLTT